MVPVKALLNKDKILRDVFSPSSDGILPFSLLTCSANAVTAVQAPNDGRIVLVKPLVFNAKYVRDDKSPKEVGMLPLNKASFMANDLREVNTQRMK
jgi:hypothetical protein